jgi:retron-type reverse transcriptase
MPRTFSGLFAKATSWENIIRAYKETRAKKKNRVSAVAVHERYDVILCRLREELVSGVWSPVCYKNFSVWNTSKKRSIEAPRFKDRIVHHAVVQVLEPLFEKKFISDSYSCRKGRGPHTAVERIESFLRKCTGAAGECYVLKCDVSKFFPSIDHDILMGILARTVREKEMLSLIKRAMIAPGNESGKGLPIGALTSQLLSNVYMSPFDDYVKNRLRIPYYVRYADDFVILDRSKDVLKGWLRYIDWFLSEKLQLRLNPKTSIFKSHQGIDFCGYRIWATHRLPRKRVVRDAKKRMLFLLWQYSRGEAEAYSVSQSFASFGGYMSHCKGHRTKTSLLKLLKGWFEKHARCKVKRE